MGRGRGRGAYDCSGLVYAAAPPPGIDIARHHPPSGSKTARRPAVPDPAWGSAAVQAATHGTASDPGHVVMYLGNGQVIQAQTQQVGHSGRGRPGHAAAATRPVADRQTVTQPESSSGDILMTSRPPAPPLPNPSTPP